MSNYREIDHGGSRLQNSETDDKQTGIHGSRFDRDGAVALGGWLAFFMSMKKGASGSLGDHADADAM
ncbi:MULTISPECIES: hypothetical protein [unclassified Brenneria]|uniref:hypothetical protein n=1 Tax=unclassified Brenneria TaxID=2634434 RepID=UPI0018F0FF54|nr:hypothetical protein [Brenneria sp. L3-3C-1]MBJ7223553.1 hypothetical protein [Brenneria sp. L3-3C-1]MEE3644795.1 hypothetical protein [Brenneria sp. L3_3C_1]